MIVCLLPEPWRLQSDKWKNMMSFIYFDPSTFETPNEMTLELLGYIGL